MKLMDAKRKPIIDRIETGAFLMQHRRIVTRLLGGMGLLAGLMFLIPPAILLNERYQLFRTSWGIFDIQVAGVRVSNSAAGVILASIGIPLLVLGSVLTFRQHKSFG
jgi:hypothetical protein